MKRGAWITLVVLVVLGAVFLATRHRPSRHVEAPLVLEPIDDLSRIEIASSGDAPRPERVVLEKREERWWITSPIEYPLSKKVAGRLEYAFGTTIRADDLKLNPNHASKYGLDEQSAVMVSAWGRGSESADRRLEVGKEIAVPGTGVWRTYIRRPGHPEIYRVQTSLGEWVHKELSELRDKQIQRINPKTISALTVERAGDAAIRLERHGRNWQLVQPQPEGPVDQSRVADMLEALANLRAVNFVDDPDPSQLGLEPPPLRIHYEAQGRSGRLAIGSPPTKPGTFYLQLDDAALVYEIGRSTAEALDVNLSDLQAAPQRSNGAGDDKPPGHP